MNVSHWARTLTPPRRANAGFDSNRNRTAAHGPTLPAASAPPRCHNITAIVAAATRSAAGTAASRGRIARIAAYVRWIAGGF